MRNSFTVVATIVCLLLACTEDAIDPTSPDSPDEKTTIPGNNTSAGFYFPPISGSDWNTITPDSLGWNAGALDHVLTFLGQRNTYGFIILHRGNIVIEKYWNDWNMNTAYPIASAGKSITAYLVGIAQQEGLLNIGDRTSSYLGNGWTSMSGAREGAIRISHHLAMTTGIDDVDDDCMTPACLKFRADAGTRWAYHNGAYNLLHKIVEEASNMSFDAFTKTRLADVIGLSRAQWNDHILDLSTRDMARFGLLVLNRGKWNGRAVLQDSRFLNAMVASSSPLNPAYGYLWWLNGKSAHRVPGDGSLHNGSLVPGAPRDLFAAMGKGDKKIYVVPSLDLVIIRHGDDAGTPTFGPSSFDTEFWDLMMQVFRKTDD